MIIIKKIGLFSMVLLLPVWLQGQTDLRQFTLLKPGKTGVKFNNALHDTREANIMIYSNFYGGAGVGIGDINNDGLQDLYFAGNQVGDRLYLNRGDMTFKDITQSAGIKDNGGWSSGVLFGDINNDGWQDIYVTRELYDDAPDLRRNKLYINNGDNTFTEQSAAFGLDNSERTRHAAFIDYDRDGDLDLLLLNQPPNPGDYSKFYKTELLLDKYSPRLMQNDGGHFSDVTQRAGLLHPGFPNSVSACDLNNDGWTDLYIANDFWVRDFIYINNGDGTFTDKSLDMTRHISFSSMGVDAADINNDGLSDVFVLDMVAENNLRRKSNMSGMPQEAFMKVVKEKGGHQYMFNMLHLNMGHELFSDIAQYAGVSATDWSWSVLMADFDNDGWKDIHIANGLMRDIRNNDAARTFSKYLETTVQKYIATHPNPQGVSIWDLVDINKALALTPSEKLTNYTYKNRGDMTFQKVNNEWGMPEKTFSNGSAYADLDNDGDLDLVVNNINDVAGIYRNNAGQMEGQNFLRVVPVTENDGPRILNTKVWVTAGGQKQYEEICSVRGMYSTSEHIAHFGLGHLTKADQVIVQWTDGKQNILKNVRANQLIKVRHSKAKAPDALPTKEASAMIQDVSKGLGLIIRHNDNRYNDYSKQLMLPYKLSSTGPCLATGDVNGDGLEDIFMGGATNTEGRLFVQQPDGTFGVMPFPDLKLDRRSEDTDALFFDIDNDGDLDLYIVSGGNAYRNKSKAYQDRLYINDGNGHLSKSPDRMPILTESGARVIAADYDRDGDTDLFVAGRHTPWQYPTPTKSTLLRNDHGKLTDVTQTVAKDLLKIGMVNDAVWADYNGDALPDLILAGTWMPITILQNQGQSFVNVTDKLNLTNTTGWWFSVAAKDIDKDGDQDFVLGNLGLNYEYKSTDEHPFEIFYDDFDNNGTGDIVLAKYEGDRLYPVRERNRSVKQVPLLAEKFPTFESFAKADVYEIYGRSNLDRSLHYTAKTFSSVYVENLGDGRVAVHPLPDQAQLSSINTIFISDINKDGHDDLLLGQNLYDAEVETVRADAGVGMALAGDGSGHWTPIASTKSGFLLPYEVTRLVPFRYRDARVIIAGCHNDFYRFLKIGP